MGHNTEVDRAIAVAGDSDVQGVEQLGEHSVVSRTLLRTVPVRHPATDTEVPADQL